MADSDIIVGGLTAVGGIGQVALRWSQPIDTHTPGGLPYLQKAAVEVWAGPANDRGAVTTVKIGEEGDANGFLHSGLARGETHYYWIRARNRAGRYGEWHPLSSYGGVHATESSILVAADTGYFSTPNGMLEQWGRLNAITDLPLDANRRRVLTFPVPFETKCVDFILTPGESLSPGLHIISFNVKEITPAGVRFNGVVYRDSGIAYLGLSEYADTPLGWRALGY